MKSLEIKKTTLTSLATLSAASASQAAIVFGSDVSVMANLSGDTAAWDIDGNSESETSFNAFAVFSTIDGTSVTARNLSLNSFDVAAGFGFLENSNRFQLLSDNYVVGVAGNFVNGMSRTFSTYSDGGGGESSSFLFDGALAEGVDHRIGFRFERGGDTHYGVADLNYLFDINAGLVSFSLSNVLWNDVADEAITGAGAAVPEPASAATGLGLLALGAVGVRCWRRDRKELS